MAHLSQFCYLCEKTIDYDGSGEILSLSPFVYISYRTDSLSKSPKFHLDCFKACSGIDNLKNVQYDEMQNTRIGYGRFVCCCCSRPTTEWFIILKTGYLWSNHLYCIDCIVRKFGKNFIERYETIKAYNESMEDL